MKLEITAYSRAKSKALAMCRIGVGSLAKRQVSVMHPKLKQGRDNSHTVTRPACVQRQLVPPSGKAASGQNKQVTPLAMPSLRVPRSV
ncbi:hypothetical protein JOQ06_029703 [Pogonophryne albipinna]|uniref:Uncharacterized protein n=1 Tax=Pogonophryne albipinna TaxID=1090488 RepID=A0AAD6FGD8_9TELE|nr:hypothetical protein JOQ06_029703 [Pogonophryne albipinna]